MPLTSAVGRVEICSISKRSFSPAGFFKPSRVVAHETEQTFRAALLLALDHHRDVERQLAGHRLEGATGLHEGRRLAFVIAGAARDDDLAAAIERFNARLERGRLPQIEWIHRLHVVVTVEKNARRMATALPVAAFADHDRMSLGRPYSRVEPETAQVGGNVLGRRSALRRVRRIGGDRLNAQKFKEPVEA
jgi:hypothetical protein